MKSSMTIKKVPKFSLGLSNEIHLQDIFYSHLDYNLDDIIYNNGNFVEPISVVIQTSSHKRIIKLNNYFSDDRNENEYFKYSNILNTYFIVNMLKINNKLYFTSFNGGKYNSNKKTVSPIDKSLIYNQCLFDLVPSCYDYKNDKNILDYSNKIIGIFWQSTFYNPLFSFKSNYITIDKLPYKIKYNGKLIILTDEIY